nr:hypothetical protein [Tanacetum cinerariifolium]
MWFDIWDMHGLISGIIPRKVWYEERYSDNEKVTDMIERVCSPSVGNGYGSCKANESDTRIPEAICTNGYDYIDSDAINDVLDDDEAEDETTEFTNQHTFFTSRDVKAMEELTWEVNMAHDKQLIATMERLSTLFSYL